MGCGEHVRVSLLVAKHALLTKLEALVIAGFTHWDHIPYRFPAVVGHIYGRQSIEESREIRRECLAERDAVIAAGDRSKLHRVAVRLCLDRANGVAAELEAFTHPTTGGLQSRAHLLLRNYLWAMLCTTRKTEGIHSRIHHWLRVMRSIKPVTMHSTSIC